MSIQEDDDTLVIHVDKYIELYHAFQSIYKSAKYLTPEQFNSLSRNELDPHIFRFLKNEYGNALKQHWNTNTIPKESNNAIIIVERKCHPNLEFVLHNAFYFAPNYSIHIFCSNANYEFVKHICNKQLNNIHIYIIFPDIANPEKGKIEYNQLLQTRTFWETFNEENLLTIETDSYLLDFIPDSIYQYDYVASKWGWHPELPGGGGLSFRKKSAMLALFDNPDIKTYPAQDFFVAEGMKLMQFKYPTFEESKYFFSENTLDFECIGTHQWWTFASKASGEQLFLFLHKFLSLNING
jgi:hypothetical protein